MTLLVGVAGIATSCAPDQGTVVLSDGENDAGSMGSFHPAAEDASYAPDVSEPLCPTNTCPSGRATCSSRPFPCEVDVLWDDLNCGACGNECPVFPSVHTTSACVDGACVFQCGVEQLPRGGPSLIFANCNGLLEDGCEVEIAFGHDNCGACGVKCGELENCVKGECKCAIQESCGACGNVCVADETLPQLPPEWNAEYGCVTNECNRRRCKDNYADCNGDLTHPDGDGCETNLNDDAGNCSQCGVACPPGTVCEAGMCGCSCGSSCFHGLGSDPTNCGACGNACEAAPGAEAVCNNGVCESRCRPGRADCDHDLGNGCETNVFSDPVNCGGCGIRCTGTEGQACVEGRCTMKECEVK